MMTMLVDTGASHTMVDSSLLAEQLLLKPTGSYKFHSASTQAHDPDVCDAYPVSLALGGADGQYPWRFETIEVMGSRERRPYGLLGCDILTLAHLEWRGPQRELFLLWN